LRQRASHWSTASGCDACVEACPVDATTSEDQVPAEWQQYIGRNAEYFKRASR
jgi:ferredoxin